MGKRAKLEEAIDYVGLMIKNLKDKRKKWQLTCQYRISKILMRYN